MRYCIQERSSLGQLWRGGWTDWPHSATEVLVTHVGALSTQTPQSSDLLRLDKTKDSSWSVQPLDVTRVVLGIGQCLQQELPQMLLFLLSPRSFCTQTVTSPVSVLKHFTGGRTCMVYHGSEPHLYVNVSLHYKVYSSLRYTDTTLCMQSKLSILFVLL